MAKRTTVARSAERPIRDPLDPVETDVGYSGPAADFEPGPSKAEPTPPTAATNPPPRSPHDRMDELLGRARLAFANARAQAAAKTAELSWQRYAAALAALLRGDGSESAAALVHEAIELKSGPLAGITEKENREKLARDHLRAVANYDRSRRLAPNWRAIHDAWADDEPFLMADWKAAQERHRWISRAYVSAGDEARRARIRPRLEEAQRQIDAANAELIRRMGEAEESRKAWEELRLLPSRWPSLFASVDGLGVLVSDLTPDPTAGTAAAASGSVAAR